MEREKERYGERERGEGGREREGERAQERERVFLSRVHVSVSSHGEHTIPRTELKRHISRHPEESGSHETAVLHGWWVGISGGCQSIHVLNPEPKMAQNPKT